MSLLALLVMAACKAAPTPGGATPSAAPAILTPTPTAAPPPVILKINLGGAPATIDPALVAPLDSAGNDLVANLFAGLTLLDGDSGQIKPLLAQSWQSSDQVTWAVTLRDDVFWVRINPDTGQLEKGRPVSAADAVAAARRACRPDTHAPMTRAVALIRGCSDILTQDPAKVTDDLVAQTVAVQAIGDHQVQYTLAAPTPYFPTILSMPALAPVPADLIAQQKDAWTKPDQIWTDGPFTVRPGVPAEQGYALVANSFWPVERDGNVSGLEIVFDPAGQKSLAELTAGEVALTTLPGDQIARVNFQDDPHYRLLATPAVTFIAMSYDTQPFDNPNVRRAFGLALDKAAIVKSVLAPQGVAGLPAQAIIPPGSAGAPGFNEIGAASDPAAAKAALAAAGYANCARLPQVTLLTDESALSKLLATAYAQQWSDVLGCPLGVIKVTPDKVENVQIAARTVPAARSTRRAALVSLGWQADYPDSIHWLADILACREQFPGAYLNQSRPCDDADGGVTTAASTADPDQRAALYKSIENAWFGASGDMPVIPVYFDARALAIGPNLTVLPLHAGPLRFDQWVEGK